MKTLGSIGLFAAYVGTILSANYVTTHYGMVPVWFGVSATAGTLLIGLLLILRDSLQDLAGKVAVLAAIVAGAATSYLISDPSIATASVAAFACAELIDFAIYTPLRKRGYVRAAVASNIVGSIVDTFAFLYLASPFLSKIVPGFSIGAAAPGQFIGKLLLTGVAILAIAAYRGRRLVLA